MEERIWIFSQSFRDNHRLPQARIASTHSRSRHTRCFQNTCRHWHGISTFIKQIRWTLLCQKERSFWEICLPQYYVTQKWKYWTVCHTFKKVNFILWVWGFHRRADSRSSHSHLQFHKTKKKIIGRVRPHIRESITDRTIYGTSSASSIHHRTEINTVNLWNIKSRRIKCTLILSLFTTKETVSKQSSETSSKLWSLKHTSAGSETAY